jgi:hypothetical protein
VRDEIREERSSGLEEYVSEHQLNVRIQENGKSFKKLKEVQAKTRGTCENLGSWIRLSLSVIVVVKK